MMWHQGMYAVWAVRRHVNSDFFGSDEDAAWDQKEKQLANLPLDVFKQFVDKLTREHEAAISVGRTPSEEQQQVLATLRSLSQRIDTDSIQIEQNKGRNLNQTTIKLNDKEAQAALNAALKQIVKDKRGMALSSAF